MRDGWAGVWFKLTLFLSHFMQNLSLALVEFYHEMLRTFTHLGRTCPVSGVYGLDKSLLRRIYVCAVDF